MQVNPLLSEQYDYALTENPEQLQERKKNFELIYDIFIKSPYNDGRFNVSDNKGATIIKVPKENIAEVFEYMRHEIQKVKTISAVEMVIVINEFFEFNYDFVYKKVLTPQMKQAVIEDLQANHIAQNKIEKTSSIKLF